MTGNLIQPQNSAFEQNQNTQNEDQDFTDELFTVSFLKSSILKDSQENSIDNNITKVPQVEKKLNYNQFEQKGMLFNPQNNNLLQVPQQVQVLEREEELIEKLKKKSLLYNSHKNFIDEKSINILRNYRFVQNQLNKSTKEIQEKEKKSETIMNKIKSQLNNNQLQNSFYENNSDLVRALLFTLLRKQEHQVFITDEKIKYSTAQTFQSQLIFTGQYENIRYLQLKIEDSSNLNYDLLMQNENKKQEFLKKFIKTASKQYGISPEKITILGLQKGSMLVDHYVEDQSHEQIQNCNVREFKQVYGKTYLKYKSLLDNFEISPDYFNSNYDMYWDDSHKYNIDYRGSLYDFESKQNQPERYYFPVGYFGFGINVQKWLEQEQQWFGTSSDQNVWIVLFHGTNQEGIKGIAKSYIIPGENNIYGRTKCRITGKIIKHGANQNVYLSNMVEEAAEYSGVDFGDKKYYLIFQCRVNPQNVRSPINRKEYYTVHEEYAQQSIRPYRILIKEHVEKQLQQ